MDTKSYYAMTFYNTTDTMQTEKKAKELFPIRVMPTPRAVSVSCGLAIRFEGEDEPAYTEFAKHLTVPVGFYHIEPDESGEMRSRAIFVREP